MSKFWPWPWLMVFYKLRPSSRLATCLEWSIPGVLLVSLVAIVLLLPSFFWIAMGLDLRETAVTKVNLLS